MNGSALAGTVKKIAHNRCQPRISKKTREQSKSYGLPVLTNEPDDLGDIVLVL